MENNKFLRSSFRYIFEFMAAGFIGWIYEVVTVRILYGKFVNRGMLWLPIIPIYAVGAFMLLLLLRKKRNPLIIFFFSAVITTLFELGASYLLEFIFHRQFWTYEGWWFSILDRSCGISSAIFGVFAVAYFRGLHPVSEKLSQKLPLWFCALFSSVSVIAVLTDLIIAVKKML